MKSFEEYGPLAFLIGDWKSAEGYTGENQAPDSERETENTNFRQESTFRPIDDVENHEQLLKVLDYQTLAYEEGNEEAPFHREVGYFIWDKENAQVMKCFCIPRGISLNAGGHASEDASSFSVSALLDSPTYGLCSNLFLHEEFRTIKYEVTFAKIDDDTFSYDEDSHLLIKGRKEIFHHTEKNIMKKVK